MVEKRGAAVKGPKAVLSASDIFDQVHGSSNSSLIFTGLIDRSDDEQSILFASGSDCQDWRKIPTSTIEKVQFIQTVRCKDHTHPLVHIFFREPQNDEGRAFAAVAHQQRAAAPVGSAHATAFSISNARAPASSTLTAANRLPMCPDSPPQSPDAELHYDIARKCYFWG
jgi:hypothetical protein